MSHKKSEYYICLVTNDSKATVYCKFLTIHSLCCQLYKATMVKFCERRMLKEMKMVEKYPIDAVRIVQMDPFVWIVEMEVPVNSTIQSDTITLNITFGDCYPISPPDIRIVGNPMVWGGMLEQRYFWLDFKTRKQILLFIWVMKKSDKIPNGAIEYMSDLISQFIYSKNFCFQDQWVPTYTTHTVLVYIQALLSNVKVSTPVSYTSFDTDPTDCTITY